MKRCIMILILASLTGLTACNGQKATGPLEVDFIHDYNQGLALAKEQGKPIMLVFEADWCAACQELKASVFTNKKVGNASRQLVNIAVNVDKDSESPGKYQVRYIPSIFFLDPLATKSMPYQGPRTPESFIEVMNSFGEKFPS